MLPENAAMRDQVSDLLRRGRALAREDRERLVDQLLESLNEPAVAELEAAWDAEIARRLDEYDRGGITAIDAEEVFAKARRLAQ
jgi:putative addiction module component (TIGR02574 family)